MYIHIGGEIVLRAREIVAIFDVDILKHQKEHGLTDDVLVIGENPKSIIFTPQKTYASPISPGTLRKRLT